MGLTGLPAPAGPRAGGNEPLERVLDALERDGNSHLLSPCTEEDLDALESSLAWPLPPAYRRLLTRLGGGLYYDRHEVFGARRLMVHDIELVPGALSMQARQAAIKGGSAIPFLLPLHRAENTFHWLDVRTGTVQGAGRRYPDLAAFLEAVLLPLPPEHHRP